MKPHLSIKSRQDHYLGCLRHPDVRWKCLYLDGFPGLREQKVANVLKRMEEPCEKS